MNILCMMSGGATQVINAALAGILKESEGKHEVYAAINGIDGIVIDNIWWQKEYNEKLKITPGCSIGTSRTGKLTPNQYDCLEKAIKKYRINALINIGGNGTIKQSQDIKNHFGDKLQVIVVPKTVDNDLGDKEFEDLLYTPGFPSIMEFWNQKLAILDIENKGAYTHDRVLIAQTFGRKTGFIAGAVRLFDPERKLPLLILLPEDIQPLMTIIDKIKSMERAIVIINESYYEHDFTKRKDKADQTMYGSSRSTSCQELCNILAKHKIQSRIYNPTIDQRQSINGIPYFDIAYSYNIGVGAIKTIESNDSYFMTINKDFDIYPIQLKEIGDFSRRMKPGWIAYEYFDVTDKYLEYLESIYKNRYAEDGLTDIVLRKRNILDKEIK